MELKAHRQFADKSNEELLVQYSKTGYLEIKQELVLRYLHVVKSAAIRMRDVYLGFAQMEDIVNEGVIILMNAIDKFDPTMNVKFETYISKRIRGMVIDLARKQDWIPRSTRKSARTILEATEELALEHGRMPEEHEVADHLGITVEKYHEINAKSNMFSVLSLDMILDGANENKQSAVLPAGTDSEQPEAQYLEQEFKKILADGIRALREKEQMVISLYYMEELNMKQIADVLDVSEPRVSQIHANAVRKLKEYLEQELQIVTKGE